MSLPGMHVRAATVEDLAEVVALERGVPESPHWAEKDYAEIVGGGGVRRCLFVAEAAGGLVGFAVGKIVADLGELESVAVCADARRLGVGRALCEAAMEWCRERGASALELEVRATSAGALALYLRLGFERVGLRRGYYSGPADDAVLMRLGLSRN